MPEQEQLGAAGTAEVEVHEFAAFDSPGVYVLEQLQHVAVGTAGFEVAESVVSVLEYQIVLVDCMLDMLQTIVSPASDSSFEVYLQPLRCVLS